VRIAVIAVLFVFLFRSGQLDAAKLKLLWSNPLPFLSGTVLLILGGAIGVKRWQKLLEVHQIAVPYWDAVRLTFIGFFFSSVIPGAVSGDVVKAYYVVKGREKKAEAITSILLDRVLGLYSMVATAVVVITAAWVMKLLGRGMPIWSDPRVSTISIMVWGIFLGMTLAFAFSWSRRLRDSRFMHWILEKTPGEKLVRKFYDALYVYGQHPKKSFTALLYSFVCQTPLYLGIYFMSRTVQVEGIGLAGYLFLFPVGLIFNALPILPGGLGTGEVGFEWLFNLFHSDQGAEIAFLFHVGFILIAFGIGGIFYLVGKKEYKIYMNGSEAPPSQ
jgi:hypothetical protein